MNEVYTKILKTKNLKPNKSIEFLKSRKIFDQEYFKLKKKIIRNGQTFTTALKILNHTKEF